MDATVSRMLFLHLPARHPTSFPEIELSSMVQVRVAHGLSCNPAELQRIAPPCGDLLSACTYMCALHCSTYGCNVADVILHMRYVLPVSLHRLPLC